MAVRFKFRSSANFDTVDIEGRPSISVRDLKSKIVLKKKLNIRQDFDLVFSDALTGQEYVDEGFQIPSGSSVIIKRVPAGLVPSDKMLVGSIQNSGNKDMSVVKTSLLVCEDDIDFDDFGVDLCPVPEVILSCPDLDVSEKICISSKNRNDEGRRSSEPLMVGYQKFDTDNLCEGIPRGPLHSGIEENTSVEKSKHNMEEHDEVGKAVNTSIPMQSANLPSELKCSLCNMLFKEAVMIPCCQHSFCQKCINLVLVEKGRCPKCSSSKCRVDDLLPNVSLRQAIDHFLESQLLISGSVYSLNQYAPDGESGVQAKEVSGAVTILQREPDLPHSPSATGRGSNQIAAEPVGGTGSRVNQSGANKSLKTPPLSHKIKHIVGRHGSVHPVDLKSGPEDLAEFADFQGESQPMHEEAESSIKQKKALWANASGSTYSFGAEKSFMESGRHKKGDRTCYMCGSPDHFIRDCPTAYMSRPMFQTGNVMFPGAIPGYASPRWNGPPFPLVRPFGNVYGNHGMMSFNATMVPATPFAVPAYMPSMFGSYPASGGFMKMGGAATPLMDGAERHQCHSDYSDLKEFDKRWKHSSEITRREQYFDNDESDDLYKTCHSRDRKPPINRERTLSCSEGSLTQKSHGKHRCDNNIDDAIYSVDERYGKNSCSSVGGKDQRCYHHSERASSLVEDIPSSSSRDSEERHKHHHRSSKNYKRKHCGSDCSWSHHPTCKEKDVKRKRPNSDAKRHNQKHHNCSESGLEPTLSSDHGKKRKEKDSSHGSRHSRHSSKSMNYELTHDRWRMVGGSDEDGGEEYCYYKRERIY